MRALSTAAALVAPAAAEDIRDIRAPIAIPDWWRWPLAIVISGAAALAIILFVRWWRARRARPLTPRERALEALRIAESHALEGRPRAWADLVAETMRVALSARLGSEVLPKTTSELAETAWAHWSYDGPLEHGRAGSSPALREAPRIIELLETCDLARFAMARLDATALLEWTAFAREAVDHLFAPPSPGAGGSAPPPVRVPST